MQHMLLLHERETESAKRSDLAKAGPFADAKEQHGACFVIEAPDLDAALERAALRTWPARGVPEKPDAGRMTAARHQLKNGVRQQAMVDASAIDLTLLPDEPEARRLLALMLCCDSRRAARRGAQGRFVPLKQQDTCQWSASRSARPSTS